MNYLTPFFLSKFFLNQFLPNIASNFIQPENICMVSKIWCTFCFISLPKQSFQYVTLGKVLERQIFVGKICLVVTKKEF